MYLQLTQSCTVYHFSTLKSKVAPSEHKTDTEKSPGADNKKHLLKEIPRITQILRAINLKNNKFHRIL